MSSSFRGLRILLGLLLFLIPSATPGYPPQEEVTPKPDPNIYAKEAAVVDELVIKVRFENDGRGTFETLARIKIQAESAVRSNGLLVFPYVGGDESFEIKYVRVRKPDGSVIETPLDSIQDLSSDVARSAPMYINQREKHIAVRGLAVADTLEYRSTSILNVPIAPGQFWFSHYFSRQAITRSERLEIDVPKERTVKLHSASVTPTVAESGQRRTYTFQTSHLKKEAEKDKWEAALEGTPSPDVLLSSFANWDEVASWYDSLQKTRVQLTPEIRAKAEQLTRDKKTDAEKIAAIYDYVSTSFRYIGISLGQGRYTPHSASEVLGNGFGDCKDKHTLFAALLRAVGIDARPVLISTSLKLDADVPGPALFDHVITAIPQGNTYVWLDTTPGAAPLRLLTSNLRDKLALIVLGDGKGLLAKTPADPPFPTFQHFTMTATLTDDGKLEGKARLEVRGDDEVALRQAFRNTDPTQWDQLGQTLSGAFGFGGTVDNVAAATPEDTSSAFWISYNYHRPEYGDWPNHRIILPFPFLGLPQLSEDEAKSPAGMPLGMVQEIRYEARVTLPKGFVPTVPPAVTKNNEFARYESAYSVDGSVLQGTRSLHLLQHDIPAKNRQAYVSFYKSIVEDEGQWIALVGGRITGGPHSENPEAQRLLHDGYESVQLGAPASAIKSIEQAIKLDPKLSAAWVLLASAHMMNSQFDAGASDLRKAIELDPANNRAYAILAMAYASRYRYREAIETWREFLKAFPEDRTASGNLAQLLIEEENYSEARTLLEKLVEEAPTARLHLNLGNTYLHLGEDENARMQFQKATELEPGSGTLNDAAYLMAEANRGLDHALPYAEEAVRETEAETSATPAPRYDLMSQLAAQWDTLGWVRFHRGELDAAEHYLSAAWKIWQVPVVGDHLAQVYEKQGESARAMHMYSLALAALGPKGDPRLREKLQARLKSLDSSSANLAKSQDELQKLRTFSLKAYFDAGKSAEFLVALRKGPKIDEVKFLSGEEELRKADSAIAALKFNVEFPDDGPTRIVERGVLSCSKVRHDCMFVIYPVSSSPASIRPTSVAPPAGN